ncbi:ACP S-malonyltransferase [Gemmata sp. JC673]|uniref:ACP S-malonyltransferase n=2 Tax=Gemmata algarum TaxID=2975278 RepID=A0ABU5F232_9BACT|nr:ACP S-malonyltransferase [Gemmata algarum]MDY3561395.1 ACP S-malonyltransferase [Gemmata algarum]
MSHRKRVVPPPGLVTHVLGGVVEGENELTVGRPVPPPVGLTPAGPPPGSAASAGGPPAAAGTAPAAQTLPSISMPRTAFLFPGQGAQKVGMAGALCQSLPAAGDLFRRASEILGYDLLDVCVGGPAEKLNATDVSQPAIFVASLAALEQLRATEPGAFGEVHATAGLSLGEYTALAFSGALSFEDGVRLVQARGHAMQDAAVATPSGMISVLGMEVPEVEALVAEVRGTDTLEVANLLCPGNTVVSGARAALDRFEQLCVQKGGIRTVRLAVAGAFHTHLMRPADEKLAAALAGANLGAPQVPVWSNVDARPHTDPDEIRGLLVKQVLAPVRWEETMRGLLAEGVERFYEIGPSRVLAGLLKRLHRKADIRNVEV